MINIDKLPSNADRFKDLMHFARVVLKICEEAGIRPIAYGSLVFFGYTQDDQLTVDDIDLLVPEKFFETIMKLLAKSSIEYTYSKKWHSILISQDDLKIEIDAIEFWQKDLPDDFEELRFGEVTFKAVSLKSLKTIYWNSSQFSQDVPDDKPAKYREKFETLDRIN